MCRPLHYLLLQSCASDAHAGCREVSHPAPRITTPPSVSPASPTVPPPLYLSPSIHSPVHSPCFYSFLHTLPPQPRTHSTKCPMSFPLYTFLRIVLRFCLSPSFSFFQILQLVLPMHHPFFLFFLLPGWTEGVRGSQDDAAAYLSWIIHQKWRSRWLFTPQLSPHCKGPKRSDRWLQVVERWKQSKARSETLCGKELKSGGDIHSLPQLPNRALSHYLSHK